MSEAKRLVGGDALWANIKQPVDDYMASLGKEPAKDYYYSPLEQTETEYILQTISQAKVEGPPGGVDAGSTQEDLDMQTALGGSVTPPDGQLNPGDGRYETSRLLRFLEPEHPALPPSHALARPFVAETDT